MCICILEEVALQISCYLMHFKEQWYYKKKLGDYLNWGKNSKIFNNIVLHIFLSYHLLRFSRAM